MSALLGFAIGLLAGVAIGRVLWMPVRTPGQQQAMQAIRKMAEPVAALPEPWYGYDETPIQQIRENLRGLSLAEREAVRVYEEATLKRRGILNVLKALEEERSVNGNA